MPGLTPILAETDEEAQAIAAERSGALDLDKLLVQLGRAFNYHDFRQYPLDEPFPDVSNLTLNSYKGGAERVIRISRDEKLTLRQAAYRFGRPKDDFIGSPKTIADAIERWFVERAADGFNYRVSRPGEFALFREKVLPILQERGLFRTEYDHDTLRGHLGLPIPENRWARSASVRMAAE
jgi:alkanesulfonate monooxygenase SsuD/methylene tetrahydromethanopterin reductase-like flavin-dependent oxidoreductase (luciferase family)